MQGINPQILCWARQQMGLSIEEVAAHFKKDPEFVQNWEGGLSSPSFPQLEKLAKKYKRPTAIFFFPEVPQEESLDRSFRTLPEQQIENIKPHLRFLIRKAKAMQINLQELNDGKNPAKHFLLRDFNVADKNIDAVARELRDYFGVDLSTQQEYKHPDTAFKQWRSVVERHGVFVFKDAFKDSGVSGFCLYNDVFPIIYINNSQPPRRQIFTLFHELAHLLFKNNYIGMTTISDEYLDRLSGKDKKVEQFCNKFAGKFLVPDDDFAQHLGLAVNDINLRSLANKYVVSREVILRKFFNKGEITARFYKEKVAQWTEQWTAKQRDGTQKAAGNSNFTKRAYLGITYMELAFSQYIKNNISKEQLADYLDVTVKRIPKMESLIFEERSKS